MVSVGTLHKTQALAGGIDLANGSSTHFAILWGDQQISRAEHTGEPRLDLGQQGQGRFTGAGPHPAHACAEKIKDVLNPGQRGRQKGGMPPEAEAHHMDGACG